MKLSFRFSLLLATLIFGLPTVQAQAPTEVGVSERVRQLETELERQNAKLDQLQKTISEQQAAIQLLIEKLSVISVSPEPSERVPVVAAAEPPQAPTVEQRLAKLEGQALKIGPIRFSGDFRLRYDGTFRSATKPPDPPLDHVQNSRGRYRLRLNFDTDIHPKLSFHGQLATGRLNDAVSTNQDFTSFALRAPFALSEAWIEYRPTKSIQLQGGRVQNVFADNSRFLFDDDIRFNGFNERYTASFKRNAARVASLELRAGQYILTTPNVAVIAPNSPLARAGEVVGSAGRSATLFHQGFLLNQTFNKKWSSQAGADIQIYNHANQIQLASTNEGLVLLIQPGIGIALAGPVTGTGTATTTPGGARYTAPGFQVLRLTYRLNHTGFTRGDHAYPISFNLQLARNVATGMNERDSMLAALQVGRATKRGDMGFLYVFTIKGANSMISQVTDDDLGTGTGVNIRTNHFRFEYGLSRKVTFQSLLFVQKSLRRSGQFPNFFVPVGDFAPTSYRVQQQLVFTF
ncbi:MAG TPA: putative porin [Pyrinomonadaceae bacterium]|nr:putative porin [Pyrinomonadaceae bacterium]